MSLMEFCEHSRSESLSSSSERKRKLAMPAGTLDCHTSSSETNIMPACKLGKSIDGRSYSEPSTSQNHYSTHEASTPLCTPAFQISYMSLVGDGSHRQSVCKSHECVAVIHDGMEGKGFICKLQCHLGDRVEYSQHLVPVKKQLTHTGKHCVDQSIKDLAFHGLNCIESLHQGRFSNILLASTENSQKYFVVKIINNGSHCCKRVLRTCKPCTEDSGNTEEADHLRNLSHPNIIKLISCFETRSGKRALVLEHCAVGQLPMILSKTAVMSEYVARRYFHHMLNAVMFIHSKGYALQNISLGHFLVDELNEIKLIDLSEITPLDELVVIDHHSPAGIKGFQAPETVSTRYSSYHPGIADMWSLGACLYSMVTGIVTTIHHSKAVCYKSTFIYPESIRTTLSESLHELLSGMLEYIPKYRFTINRVKYSEWSSHTTKQLSITGHHLFRQPQKVKLSCQDANLRRHMEI